MGQRTAFLIKRTFWDGSVNVRLVHHQWGIGRVMHMNFMKAVMELETYRGFQEKTLKNFMTIINDKHSTYKEQNFKVGNKRIPDVFDKATIKKYFDITDNNNGGMIIDIKEKPSDKKPYSIELEHIKISFVVGHEECNYDYKTDKYIGDEPFEKLYSGEEYVKISCGGEYAYLNFRIMWYGFIRNFEIEEISDSKLLDNLDNDIDDFKINSDSDDNLVA